MKVLSRYPLANQIACVNFFSLCLETHMGKKTLIITFPMRMSDFSLLFVQIQDCGMEIFYE